jgi:copper oxidase (laccase) domain-containing protein
MSALEFPLEQSWAKGLRIEFCDKQESQNYSLEDTFHLKQVHGDRCFKWVEAWPKNPPPEADAIWVDSQDFRNQKKPLLIKTADCLPIFFIDHQNRSLVAMHAGWRGVQKELPFLPFKEKWCDPKSTWIWVGPSLSGKSFAVKEDMWSQFPKNISDNTKYFERDLLNPDQRFFHVWKYVEDRWKSLGVELVYNVEVNTFENENFSSWRRDFKAGLSKPASNNYSLLWPT